MPAPAATGADHAATRNTVGATTFPWPFPAVRLSPLVPGQRLPGTGRNRCLANKIRNHGHAAASSRLVVSREGRARRSAARAFSSTGRSRARLLAPSRKKFSRAGRAASWYVRCRAVPNGVRPSGEAVPCPLHGQHHSRAHARETSPHKRGRPRGLPREPTGLPRETQFGACVFSI